jgi:hypothetical protein
MHLHLLRFPLNSNVDSRPLILGHIQRPKPNPNIWSYIVKKLQILRSVL